MSDPVETIEVTTKLQVPIQRVKDLVSAAMEGGVQYWAKIARYELDGVTKPEFPHINVPFMPGCAIIIDDIEGDPELSNKRLDMDAMKRGLQLMADKNPRHFKELLDEGEDAETGDVFIQLCVYGEIVFG